MGLYVISSRRGSPPQAIDKLGKVHLTQHRSAMALTCHRSCNAGTSYNTGFDPDTRSRTWLESTVASFQSIGTAPSPSKPEDEKVPCISNSCDERPHLDTPEPQYTCPHGGRRQKDYSKILQNLAVSKLGVCSATLIP